MVRLQSKLSELYSKTVDPHTECGAASFLCGFGAKTVRQTVVNNCSECYVQEAEPHRVHTAPMLVPLVYIAPAPVLCSELL
jgi:hypothetical protein